MNEGNTHNYYWIEGNEFSLRDLVTNSPQLFIGKTVAITVYDSGPLFPNDEEKKLGGSQKTMYFLHLRKPILGNCHMSNTTNGIFLIN
jgi:hypothetical protein